jgi:hypothetical protein
MSELHQQQPQAGTIRQGKHRARQCDNKTNQSSSKKQKKSPSDKNKQEKERDSEDEADEDDEVEVVKVHKGVDRRAQQQLLNEMEEEEESEEEESEEEEGHDNDDKCNGVSSYGENQKKSAREIIAGFFDHYNEGVDAEKENGGLRENALRDEIHGKNRGSVDGGVDKRMVSRALSHRAASNYQEKHMTDRVVDYCKTQLFRKYKFITDDEMKTEAVTKVMDALQIVPHERMDFVKLYTTCVTQSINTKRSTCEQAGLKIVKQLLLDKQYENGNDAPPYSMESLVKLRRSYDGSKEDLEAFGWFFGEFMDCVSGARTWGGQRKYVDHVSKAKIKGVGGNIMPVTGSDEAFGLLMYENYVDKWIQKYHHDRTALLPSVRTAAERSKSSKKMRGKYTEGTTGKCNVGGWSRKGIRRFNDLCATVINDRADPLAEQMEEYLLWEIRKKKYGNTGSAIESDDDSVHGVLEENHAIKAFCEV